MVKIVRSTRRSRSIAMTVVLCAGACSSPPQPAATPAPPSTPTVAPPDAPVVVALDPSPIAVPSGLPMIGEASNDALGEPLSSADSLGFQSLFHARRFGDLCAHITSLQDQFEADVTRERWPIDALESFNTVSAESGELLDAWVAATPDCFAAYSARGVYLYALGMTQRGTAPGAGTSPTQFALMRSTLERAQNDLRRAIELRPRVVDAAIALTALFGALSEPDSASAVYATAISACPDCLELRIGYMRALRPRWGGDPTQMHAVIASADSSRRAGLRVLDGYADYDRCYELRGARRYADSIAACDQAISAAPYWRYYFERGRSRRALGDQVAALADLDEALRLRPQTPGAMIERSQVLEALDRDREAAEQLAVVAHLIPDDPRSIAGGRRLAPAITQLLETARSAGHPDEVLALQQVLHDIMLPQAPGRPVAP